MSDYQNGYTENADSIYENAEWLLKNGQEKDAKAKFISAAQRYRDCGEEAKATKAENKANRLP